MVSQTTVNTMKWWYDTGRKPAEYFEDQVTAGKLTQAECDYILGV